MLKLENVHVSYGSIEVLHGIDIEVHKGEIVTIIGANGAGKTTTLRSTVGILPKQKGSKVIFQGKDITNLPTEKVIAEGLVLSPEGRHIFPDMTVYENLEMGAYLRGGDKAGIQASIKEMFEMFPRLDERKKQLGKTLSGGEQQMLAIARALMAKPHLLMLDEPSTGLAPMIVKDIFNIVKRLNQETGLTVLLVEQNAKIALSVADRGYVLKNGEIVLQDTGVNLLNNEDIKAAYLGGNMNK
jgi:branched-chain amino acid transport system ATP-binding protein